MKPKPSKKRISITVLVVTLLFLGLILIYSQKMNKSVYVAYTIHHRPNLKVNLEFLDKVHSLKENEGFYNLFDVNYFKNRNLSYPKNVVFKQKSNPYKYSRNEINYNFCDTLNYMDLFLFQFRNDSLSLGSLNPSLKRYWYPYEKRNSTLFIKYDNNYEPLIMLTKEPTEYMTRVGKFIVMGKKDVSFFDYHYKNVYEIHYVYWDVSSSNAISIETYWFTENFTLIRMERERDGLIKIP